MRVPPPMEGDCNGGDEAAIAGCGGRQGKRGGEGGTERRNLGVPLGVWGFGQPTISKKNPFHVFFSFY